MSLKITIVEELRGTNDQSAAVSIDTKLKWGHVKKIPGGNDHADTCVDTTFRIHMRSIDQAGSSACVFCGDMPSDHLLADALCISHRGLRMPEEVQWI